MPELNPPHRRVQRGHARLNAEGRCGESTRGRGQLRGSNDISQDRRTLHDRVVVGEEHASFPGGRQLVSVETEDANVSERPAELPTPLRSMGMRSILAVSYTHLRAHETPEHLV